MGKRKRIGRLEDEELTPKEQLFVAAYQGNTTEAARAAGYKCTSSASYTAVGRSVISRPHVALAIRRKSELVFNPLIADKQERQGFWSKVMRDEDMPILARLRASELLGKSCGDFLDRAEIITKTDATVRVLGQATRVEVLNLAKKMTSEILESHDEMLHGPVAAEVVDVGESD